MPLSRLLREPIRRVALLRVAGLRLIAELPAFAWHGQDGDPAASAAISSALPEAIGQASHLSPDRPAPASGEDNQATCTKASRPRAARGGSCRIAAFPLKVRGRPLHGLSRRARRCQSLPATPQVPGSVPDVRVVLPFQEITSP